MERGVCLFACGRKFRGEMGCEALGRMRLEKGSTPRNRHFEPLSPRPQGMGTPRSLYARLDAFTRQQPNPKTTRIDG
jgi:hypothetical protein